MLEIHNITKTYSNGVQALKGVSLSINPGLFGLLGPNGAGKSSLMRTIATLQLPDSGEIKFNSSTQGNIDWQRSPQLVKERLGFLPQDFRVYPGISAIRLLDYIAVLKGISDKAKRRQEVEALLKLTNLYQVKDKAVDSYSGGMRQRFGIAQALLGSPELIIVDEPTAGLDPQERNRFHNLLAEVSEKVVVILSTHIVEDIANLCQDTAILADGKILAKGSPESLTQAYQGKMWQLLVSPDELSRYSQMPGLLSKQLIHGKFVLKIFSTSAPDEHAVQVEPDLESVYFAILQQHNLLAL